MNPDAIAKRFLTPAALLAVLSLLSCAQPEPPPRRPVPVSVDSARLQPVPYFIPANGVVEPINSVAIVPQVSGVITRVLFSEGAEVGPGQPLLEIDPRPYQAALDQALGIFAKDSTLAASSRRDADRFGELVRNGNVSPQEADAAEATAASQAAAVQADRAAVEAARLNLDYTTIRAPIQGRTSSLAVRVGNVVRPGTSPGPAPLLTINQIHPIRVRFAIPEDQLDAVQEYFHKGTLRVAARPGDQADDDVPEETGTVSLLENAVDTTTGTVGLKAEFPNPKGRLWPGEFVTVRLELYVEPRALTVAQQAVETGQNGAYVFVVEPGDTVSMQSVTAGRTVAGRTVISEGLSPGARVVTDGQLRLEPGSRIEIVTPKAQ